MTRTQTGLVGLRRSLVSTSFKEVTNDIGPLRADFRKRHGIRTFGLRDQVIDAARLSQLLLSRFRAADGHLFLGCRILGAAEVTDRVRAVFTMTRFGIRRIEFDWLIVAAGSRTRKVMEVVNQRADLKTAFSTVATAVLRFDWPFPGVAPGIHQLFGTFQQPLDRNVAIIPVGRSKRASAAPTGGVPVKDPDRIEHDIEKEKVDMLRIMREAYGIEEVANQTCGFCLKALLVEPTVQQQEGGAAARLVTVLRASAFGGARNVLIASPGKLSGCFTLRDVVLQMITEEERRTAAA